VLAKIPLDCQNADSHRLEMVVGSARRTRLRPATPSRSATTAGSRSTRRGRTSPSGAKATGSIPAAAPADPGGRAGA